MAGVKTVRQRTWLFAYSTPTLVCYGTADSFWPAGCSSHKQPLGISFSEQIIQSDLIIHYAAVHVAFHAG